MVKGEYRRFMTEQKARREHSVVACATQKGPDSSTPMNKNALTAGCVVAAIFAFVAATGGHPYSFYTTTRWVVFLVCCWGAYQHREMLPKWTFIGFLVIGVVFNPLIPFRFKRDIWQVIDVLGGIALIAMPIHSKRLK
jgi:hypothetical protein